MFNTVLHTSLLSLIKRPYIVLIACHVVPANVDDTKAGHLGRSVNTPESLRQGTPGEHVTLVPTLCLMFTTVCESSRPETLEVTVSIRPEANLSLRRFTQRVV